jgi:lamin tail-like protein
VVYNAVGIQKTSLRHFSMEHSKRFWRGLFFILLIIALCGGLALPILSAPVRAAPQMQVTACSGTTITQWNFTGDVITPSTGIGTLNAGPGLPPVTSPTFAAGQLGGTDRAISFNNWTNSTSLDTTDYVEFVISTTGRSSIGISFDYRRSSQGPATLEFQYSVDGVNFVLVGSPVTLTATASGNTFYPLAFDLSAVTGLNDNANASFRIYAYAAQAAAGTLRLDNVTLTGNCLTYLTDTAVSANSTGTAASNLTNTAVVVNATGTAASNLTSTSAALSNTPTNTATPTNTSPASTAGVVISEFRTRGPNGASDEFIEIYNPTSTAVDISGWKINASNNAGAADTRAIIPASTLLRSGQYYLVANNGYTGSVTANLKYGTAITNDGGIALLRSNNTIVDEVGMDVGSAYQEGTTLPPFSGTSDQSYERKLGGTSDSCIDTNDNASDFGTAGSATLHNYSSPLSLCGVARPTPSTTTTTITGDNPDPSLVNGNITVSVRVTGGSAIPSGLVNITGANTNCTITLNSSGTGSCTVKFTSTGTKALIATYLGDNTHASSTDGESHLVTTVTVIRTPTRKPTPLPPPPLVGINEFVPRPGHDWNNDGVINNGDEYIELLNHGVIDVNLSGYSLDDEVNIGSAPYRLPAITLKPGERHVFYGSETGLLLSDGGDGVRLLKPNGQLMDAYNYFVVRFPDQSYCRLPDNGGLDDWNQNCFPTPGLQNSLSGSSVNPPTENGAENLCPISDTLPEAFVLAECPPFGNNIWNPDYWDKFGWFDEKNLPESPGKWPVFAD